LTDLEVLHLSDLHWDREKQTDARIVTDALIEDLKTGKDSKLISPDIVVFSGDLVNSGEDYTQFNSAYSAFLEPVLSSLNLTPNELFLAPGNHDISRKCVRESKFLDTGLLQTLQSVDVLNKFVDDVNSGNAANVMALDRLSNYRKFIDETLPAAEVRFPQLDLYRRDIRGLKVGIACFDTAWRATGEADDVDRAHLLLGERNVDNAIESLDNCDINIAVMHHPLDWLADFDEIAVSSRLSAHFDALLCGHTHRPIPQTRTTAQGTAILSQTGSVYASRRWFNGYQSLKLSITNAECRFIVRTYYDTPRRVFDAATNIMPKGEVTFPYAPQKRSSNSTLVESFLRQMRKHIRDMATSHLNIIGLESIGNLDVKEAFIVPPLSVRTNNSEPGEEGRSNGAENYEDISPEELLRSTDSFLIAGDRETGKTSLLHYFSVLCAEGICDTARIPVILNAETLGLNEYELRKSISNYFGTLPKGFDVKDGIKKGFFIFLADNVEPNSTGATALAAQVANTPSCRWICISRPRDGSITGDVEDPTLNKSLNRVRIGPLPRRSIRALSKRWSSSIGSSDEDVFDAVMKQLKTDGLPRTGYIVTLILWAMQQEKELDRVNEAMLLSNVADYLLGKADFTQSTVGKLDPRAKEITLEYFSEFVRSQGGYVSIDDAIQFLSETFKKKRLPFVASDVLTELCKCGILDRRGSAISFKYKCFEEYFFALRMKGDTELFNKVISPRIYSNYAREIEMLAGLRRENRDIIDVLRADMEAREPATMARIDRSELKRVVNSSLGVSLSRQQLSDLRKRRLTADQVDDLLDVADRRATGHTHEGDLGDHEDMSGKAASSEGAVAEQLVLTSDEPDLMSVTEYLTASNLLARVVKNSDFTDFDYKAPAARLILEIGAKLCALFSIEVQDILEETNSKNTDGKPLSAEEIRVMVYYLTKLLVKIVADIISNHLSSPNISQMMDEIGAEKETSTIERLFIAFLLQSLRFKGWESRWAELLKEGGNSGFIVESIIERMRSIVNTQYLDDREYAKLHVVIDSAEEVLGWSSIQKGHVLADLKKAALQADLRDTA